MKEVAREKNKQPDTTETNQTIRSQVSVLKTQLLQLEPGSVGTLRWLSVRRLLPAQLATVQHGELAPEADCCVGRLAGPGIPADKRAAAYGV